MIDKTIQSVPAVAEKWGIFEVALEGPAKETLTPMSPCKRTSPVRTVWSRCGLRGSMTATASTGFGLCRMPRASGHTVSRATPSRSTASRGHSFVRRRARETMDRFGCVIHFILLMKMALPIFRSARPVMHGRIRAMGWRSRRWIRCVTDRLIKCGCAYSRSLISSMRMSLSIIRTKIARRRAGISHASTPTSSGILSSGSQSLDGLTSKPISSCSMRMTDGASPKCPQKRTTFICNI